MSAIKHRPIRPWLTWAVAALVTAGFVLSMERFSVDGINPIAVFGVGAFLVGLFAIDDLMIRGVGLKKSLLLSAALGLALVVLMLGLAYVATILSS